MYKLYFLLFYEFTKIGVFAIGGGYAALPFLYYLQEKYNWFGIDELTNMIAVSNITPGPVGINMATYTGFTTAKLTGALIATIAIVLIPFIITIIITKLFTKFQNSPFICSLFTGLKPAACALLTSIGLKLLFQTITYTNREFQNNILIDYQALLLFLIIIIPFLFTKKNPLLVILMGAIGGIILQ